MQYSKNCKAILGILNKNEIAVYFVSTKIICKNEEILFDYGNIYGNLEIEEKAHL